ncbi:MAG: SpoIIE family protein phosphatase [Elusimicrobia bacterium]|nr:SpoIIE family protein phosphatase [Elusimicrobiota bacterium]
MSNQERAVLGREYPVTVLLIDDQMIVGEAVRRMLAGEKDIRFHYCSDPTKAVETAAQVCPTVILQDLVMPQMDGLLLVKVLRANPATAEIPLIVLSSKEEPRIKAEAFGLGANDYLVKLPDKLEVVARIRHHSKGYISLLERNEAFRALAASQKVLAEDLARAADYVKSLLPAPLREPLKTSWVYVPSMELGGDAFGYHWQDDKHFAMYLLDVCGHGVGAALMSVSVMNILRAHALPGVDFNRPEQVMAALNEAFQMERHNNMFFSIWYGIYSLEDRKLVCASGGHPPAVLVGQDSSVRQLEAQGTVVGAWPKASYDCLSADIAPGSKLYVFSDGIFEIEQPDGKFWQYEDFIKLLAAAPAPGEDGTQRILKQVRRVRGKDVFDDDISLFEVAF